MNVRLVGTADEVRDGLARIQLAYPGIEIACNLRGSREPGKVRAYLTLGRGEPVSVQVPTDETTKVSRCIAERPTTTTEDNHS